MAIRLSHPGNRPRAVRWAPALALSASAALLAVALAAGPQGPASDSSRRQTRFDYQRELSRADSLVRAQGGPRGERAQLYLTWNAPPGSRRASSARMPRCADSSAVDTLYLAFTAGRASQSFNGFSGRLVFHATGSDTLGTWWHFQRGAENAGALEVEWGPSPGIPHQPWSVPGRGAVELKATPAASTLSLIFAVPLGEGRAIAPDSTYTLCRVFLRHRRRLPGCDQPVCIEWREASLAFGLKDEPTVARGERFVAYAGPRAICEPFRAPGVRPWQPRGARP